MNVLVTAGPTREPLDAVRFISNRSSGRMGYAVASAAKKAGHCVRLISGPVALPPPKGVRMIRVVTAQDMLDAVLASLAWCDVLVMAAAVADWRPKKPAARKLKKQDGPPRVEWEAAPDILQTIAPLKKPTQVFCGFAAETNDLAREAKRKLRRKNLDAIAANDVSKNNQGFDSIWNALTLYRASGEVRVVPRATKEKCARQVMQMVEEIFVEKKDKKFRKIY
ncbi:MAG: phosphopantothenoylcysteine decarboxylase [Verrucomicrobiota bacterium]|jgi:phosphopantothenoylcysteine decarboxylase/phosphopantothenate--cysteine ligase|nr:phosphopantothenoylcysteine decarboxylase [Verrucomicrobiota bacterium]